MVKAAFAWKDSFLLDRPLAANQLVQKKRVDMQSEIGLGIQGALILGRVQTGISAF